MQKRSRKLPTDVSQRARAIVDLATAEQAPQPSVTTEPPEPEKNPAAVALRRRIKSEGPRS